MAVIREATEKDVPRIMDLYQQLSLDPVQPGPPPYKAPPINEARRIFRKMSEYPDLHLLVADEMGFVVGTALLAILPGFAHGTSPFAVVEYIVVDEPYRSKGIGKLMMASVKSFAKSAGCYKIMLTSDLRRVRAHRFYEQVGYQASAAGFRLYL